MRSKICQFPHIMVLPYHSIAFDIVFYLPILMKCYKIQSFNAMLYHVISLHMGCILNYYINSYITILLIWTIYKVWQLMCHVTFSISYNMEQYNIEYKKAPYLYHSIWFNLIDVILFMFIIEIKLNIRLYDTNNIVSFVIVLCYIW